MVSISLEERAKAAVGKVVAGYYVVGVISASGETGYVLKAWNPVKALALHAKQISSKLGIPELEEIVGDTVSKYTEEILHMTDEQVGALYESLKEYIDPASFVVIKCLGPVADVGDYLQRFEREGDVYEKLNHPNIIKLHERRNASFTVRTSERDIQVNDPCHVMEHVDTIPLEALMGHVTMPQFGKISRGLISALSHAHKKGIIHRDLKPHNVFVTQGYEPKLADFGIATDSSQSRLTQGDTRIGTPSYMSPEQAMGVKYLDERTDVYSLGGTLYAMLTGRHPVVGKDAVATLIQLQNKADLNIPQIRQLKPDVPELVARMVDLMLTYEKEDRPSSMDECRIILEDLEGAGVFEYRLPEVNISEIEKEVERAESGQSKLSLSGLARLYKTLGDSQDPTVEGVERRLSFYAEADQVYDSIEKELSHNESNERIRYDLELRRSALAKIIKYEQKHLETIAEQRKANQDEQARELEAQKQVKRGRLITYMVGASFATAVAVGSLVAYVSGHYSYAKNVRNVQAAIAQKDYDGALFQIKDLGGSWFAQPGELLQLQQQVIESRADKK